MPRVELVGGFYQDSATQFDTQRCVNMYPVISSDDGGKGKYKLKGVQGLVTFTTFTDERVPNINNIYTTSTGRLYVFLTGYLGDFSGYSLYFTDVYELNSSGVKTLIGSIPNKIPLGENIKISLSDNGIVISIVYKGYTGTASYFRSYFLKLSDNSLNEITDSDFPDAVFSVYYKDTYFIWCTKDRFYISTSMASDPASCVNALDFGTVESNPDKIVGLIGLGNEVAIFGENTIEYYYNSGNVDFPFERNSGATQEIGTISGQSISKINNEIFFLGSNKSGYGIVYMMRGYQPERISSHAIENEIKKSTLINNCIAYTYQDGGNYFYVLTINDINKTFVYNATTGLWHEMAHLENNGTYSRHKSNFHAFAFNKNFLSSNADGSTLTVSYLSDIAYKNNTTSIIRRERILRHISFENKVIQINSFELDIQKGVGSVLDVNPVINLYISRDGGMTYGNAIALSMGAASDYKLRCRASMLGISRDTVFKLISDSSVQHEWIAAYVNYEVMSE